MNLLTAPSIAVPGATRPWHLAEPDDESGIGGGDDRAYPLHTDAPSNVRSVLSRPSMSPSTVIRSIRIVRRPSEMFFADVARRQGVVRYQVAGGPGRVALLTHPAHIKALMTADPALAPSATRMSPLAPIVGSQSVLTSIGQRHRRQRSMLLPRFHGKAVAAYRDGIDTATATHIDAWPTGELVPVADIAQQITLDVIMSAVFGLPGGVPATDAERALRDSTLRMLRWSATPVATVAQLLNSRSSAPVGLTKMVLRPLDRALYQVLAERRGENDSGRNDITQLLLDTRDEDGEPLPDSEIRDELVTLLLAGHETTTNAVAWTFERLTRYPDVYADAREAVQAGNDNYLDALLNESMRTRPVVPVVARTLMVPWQFGDQQLESGVTALVSVLLLHHRDDLYPRPFAFDPSRFFDVRPTAHTLMPFGGGIRRCLGAPLAMAEMRTVVTEILRRVDLETTDRPAERPQHRNVTMIPADGGLVRARSVS
ncbi:cytochrome P450 [Gordonia sp. (in: high G+C Gram-positive bacteria)]|jgi:cytochrome P450|uniref:cytochrome P450 n=1 Tax=Gordonia sp. (in: high G+C Gram-positive bacteria) TaxID=84139 RepID=UPI001D6E4309|nr:cytochrome P450 [Gordonia sp. (in: high G+C Gram-positive bacteria)]MCB1294063.1 cytochrome P450 [Gordonia sp. (in: high G+C Gram-positive bacteria)]HMS76051.1 cytochrome P450 [Gordonia sp. (in: high G+C Gram-positive bacteria)]HQV16874.1 cytochrome P450 [Gordonia sp. (in: high G+C Gram-positive bacteria)]